MPSDWAHPEPEWQRRNNAASWATAAQASIEIARQPLVQETMRNNLREQGVRIIGESLANEARKQELDFAAKTMPIRLESMQTANQINTENLSIMRQQESEKSWDDTNRKWFDQAKQIGNVTQMREFASQMKTPVGQMWANNQIADFESRAGIMSARTDLEQAKAMLNKLGAFKEDELKVINQYGKNGEVTDEQRKTITGVQSRVSAEFDASVKDFEENGQPGAKMQFVHPLTGKTMTATGGKAAFEQSLNRQKQVVLAQRSGVQREIDMLLRQPDSDPTRLKELRGQMRDYDSQLEQIKSGKPIDGLDTSAVETERIGELDSAIQDAAREVSSMNIAFIKGDDATRKELKPKLEALQAGYKRLLMEKETQAAPVVNEDAFKQLKPGAFYRSVEGGKVYQKVADGSSGATTSGQAKPNLPSSAASRQADAAFQAQEMSKLEADEKLGKLTEPESIRLRWIRSQSETVLPDWQKGLPLNPTTPVWAQ